MNDDLLLNDVNSLLDGDFGDDRILNLVILESLILLVIMFIKMNAVSVLET